MGAVAACVILGLLASVLLRTVAVAVILIGFVLLCASVVTAFGVLGAVWLLVSLLALLLRCVLFSVCLLRSALTVLITAAVTVSLVEFTVSGMLV